MKKPFYLTLFISDVARNLHSVFNSNYFRDLNKEVTKIELESFNKLKEAKLNRKGQKKEKI